MVRIAVIGWGSLIWDPRNLKLADRQWHDDGPKLPVEFARVARDGRLTLVITPRATPQTTLWACSGCETLDKARADLAKREGSSENNIGALRKGEIRCDATEQTIANWCEAKEFDGVVWTKLPPKAQDGSERVMAREEAVNYIMSLEGEKFRKAEEYVKKAPEQIDTPIRRALMKMFASR